MDQLTHKSTLMVRFPSHANSTKGRNRTANGKHRISASNHKQSVRKDPKSYYLMIHKDHKAGQTSRTVINFQK